MSPRWGRGAITNSATDPLPRENLQPEGLAYNRAFARRRVKAEHTIGRLRRYEALTHTDRHCRRGHTARVRAVAGLVNRQVPPQHA